MKRKHIIFKGNVQGVGFRYSLSLLAKQFDLTGNCQNLPNGDVEAYLQGEEKDIEELIENISSPLRYFEIKNVLIDDAEYDPYEHSFKIVY